MTALLPAISIFCVRAECKAQLASYNSKHTPQCLSDKPFVCTYMHNLKITSCIWTFCTFNNYSV